MRDYVSQYHFVVRLCLSLNEGRFSDVETNLCVFDQKTLAIVQTIASRRMFGHVGKGNFLLVPVKTGSGEAPLSRLRFRAFTRKDDLPGSRWLRRSYSDIEAVLKLRLALDGVLYNEQHAQHQTDRSYQDWELLDIAPKG